MELKTYINILLRRKWVILITAIVTLGVVVAGTLMATPIYSAKATLRIATAGTGSISYSDYMYADRLINTYVQMATTKPVLDELKKRLSLDKLPAIEVKSVPNTELIEISVEHQDPTQAANIANTLAEVLIGQSLELYTGSGQSSMQILSTQVAGMEEDVNQARQEYLDLVAKNPTDTAPIQTAKQAMDLKQQIYASTLDQYEQTRLREALLTNSVSIVDPATPPPSPAKPRKVLNIGLGLMVGLIAGLGLAFVYENLDSTIYSIEHIEELTNLPNLGSVPHVRDQKLFVSANGNNPYIEDFRRIRTLIFSRGFDQPHHALLITSPEPRDGKSTIISGLAATLAESGSKVVLVDADLRLPSQHKIFGLQNDHGLTDVLTQKLTLKQALQETNIPNLHVLTSGPVPGSPSKFLDTIQIDKVITRLRQSYDLLLIDTPALMEVDDTPMIAPHVDGVVLVVCLANSVKEDVISTCKRLEDIKANVIGFVVNQTEQKYGKYYYSAKTTSNRNYFSIWQKLKRFRNLKSLTK